MTTLPAETRARIIELLERGATDRNIARIVGVDRKTPARFRRDLKVPAAPRKPPPSTTVVTVEERWRAYASTADGQGHVTWTGRLAGGATPVMSYRSRTVTARSVAYRMHTGRDPVGYVKPDCGQQNCVAPEHQEDEQDRVRERAILGDLLGRRSTITACTRGHAVATHRKYLADGSGYCGTCHQKNKRARRAAS
ncbi:hypothetical protein [Streptomyces microflavus]|uniref:hypothetical protein n=1 Tax=Streptomyces microflavus TaxID=1919 RepID=UPI002E351563|nr:hypothetical protein [Streptomyces microflavus]